MYSSTLVVHNKHVRQCRLPTKKMPSSFRKKVFVFPPQLMIMKYTNIVTNFDSMSYYANWDIGASMSYTEENDPVCNGRQTMKGLRENSLTSVINFSSLWVVWNRVSILRWLIVSCNWWVTKMWQRWLIGTPMLKRLSSSTLASNFVCERWINKNSTAFV